MELRKKMRIPGKHPGCKTCANLGTPNCKCKENATPSGIVTSAGADDALVAEITKKVLAALGR